MTHDRKKIKSTLRDELLKLGGEAPVGQAGLDWAVDKALDIVESRNEVPLRDRVLINVQGLDEGVGDENYDGVRREAVVVDSEADANVITSKEKTLHNLADIYDYHQVVLDLDVPCVLVPSSTEGHFHHYIEHDVHWDEYQDLLEVLAKIGLVEEGYVEASKREGYTSARLPWVRKQDSSEGKEVL